MKKNGGNSFWRKIGEVLNGSPEQEKPSVKINSFEQVTLCESGMRGSVVYELLMKDGQAEVSEYQIRYTQGADERVLSRQNLCEESEALKILNDCRLLSWDGFHGAHPKGVLDGIMFHLEAFVNGGRRVYADGSQNFPKHYREFRDWIYGILNPKNQ